MKTDFFFNRFTLAVGIVAILPIACVVSGQQTTDSRVNQTTFTQSAAGKTAKYVTFNRQAAKVGDEAEQTLDLDLRMNMTMCQAKEVVGKNLTTVHTDQKRMLATTAVENGRAIAIRLQYPVATKQESILEGPNNDQPTVNPQPVQGKTYLCHRDAGENGKLIITDEAGNLPPREELEIVAQQMQMVGRPNPLADYLDTRKVVVGEKLEVPNAVASQLFNLGDKFGKVSRFTLTLERVQEDGNATYAVFRANVDAVSAAATQMRLEVEGPLVVDVATCRAQKISLIGPIGMSETRGSYSTAYQIIGTGKLKMSIASTYRDAKR